MTCALVLATGCGEQGALRAEPAIVDFGVVAAGATVRRTVTIRSGVERPVTVDALTVASVEALDGELALAGALDLPVQLAAGEALEVEVAFTASGTRRAESTLRWTAEPPEHSGEVELVGRGAGPSLRLVPTQIGFGVLDVGSTSERTLSLTNAGMVDLPVHVSLFEGDAFALEASAVAFQLPVGATREVPVTFEPPFRGLHSAVLQVAAG